MYRHFYLNNTMKISNITMKTFGGKDMKKFTFEKTISKRGNELIEAYKTYLDPNTSPIVKDAIRTYLLKERSAKFCNAVSNKVSVEELTEVVASIEAYLTGTKEIQNAALLFIAENVPAGIKIDAFEDGKNYVSIQKRIGMKSVDFQKYFGTTPVQTSELYRNGFAQTFVNTRVRKCIMDVLNARESNNFKLIVSDCFKDEKRNLYNIAINFKIPIKDLDNIVCEEIVDIIKHLESTMEEFTC